MRVTSRRTIGRPVPCCQRDIELNPLEGEQGEPTGRSPLEQYRSNADGKANRWLRPHVPYLELEPDPASGGSRSRAGRPWRRADGAGQGALDFH